MRGQAGRFKSGEGFIKVKAILAVCTQVEKYNALWYALKRLFASISPESHILMCSFFYH
jgi:hypothetical protein